MTQDKDWQDSHTEDLKVKPREFLEYPLVIDWLQWNDFKIPLNELDYPQITLTLISDMKKKIKQLEKELSDLRFIYEELVK